MQINMPMSFCVEDEGLESQPASLCFCVMPATMLKKNLQGQAPRVKQNHYIGSQSHTQTISRFMLYKYLFHLSYKFSFNS